MHCSEKGHVLSHAPIFRFTFYASRCTRLAPPTKCKQSFTAAHFASSACLQIAETLQSYIPTALHCSLYVFHCFTSLQCKFLVKESQNGGLAPPRFALRFACLRFSLPALDSRSTFWLDHIGIKTNPQTWIQILTATHKKNG